MKSSVRLVIPCDLVLRSHRMAVLGSFLWCGFDRCGILVQFWIFFFLVEFRRGYHLVCFRRGLSFAVFFCGGGCSERLSFSAFGLQFHILS